MHSRKVRLLAIAAIALSSCALAGSADYWRWTGADGSVHYGETPPPGVKAERIHVSTGTSESGPASNQQDNKTASNSNHASDAGKNGANGGAQGISPAEAKKVCERARNNLSILQSHPLIRETGDDGKVHILSDKEKTSQIELANKLIKQYCQ